MKQKTVSQRIKTRARKSLNRKLSKKAGVYIADTSAVINRFLGRLIKKGLRGRLIIPNAVMAELENLANKGQEAGFRGLDEITKLHKLKKDFNLSVYFKGPRPSEHHIKFAKSGEIDALIREVTRQNHAILITADLVQAKTAQAYNIPVLFMRPRRFVRKKKKFFIFRRK